MSVHAAVESIDRSLHATNTWLAEISESLGHPDRQVAWHALRGTLFALRDRLAPEEAVHLGAQLPLVVRGVYFEGYTKLANRPVKYGKDGFLERVAQELSAAGGANPEKAAAAVFHVMTSHLEAGQVRHVVQGLPQDIADFWDSAV